MWSFSGEGPRWKILELTVNSVSVLVSQMFFWVFFSRICFPDFTLYLFSLRSLAWGGLVVSGAGLESLIFSSCCCWKSPGIPSALDWLKWLKYPQYFPTDCFRALKLLPFFLFICLWHFSCSHALLCDDLCLFDWWLIRSAFLSPSSLTPCPSIVRPSLFFPLVFGFVWMPWSCNKSLTQLWPLCVWQPDVWGRRPEVMLTTRSHVLNHYKDRGLFWPFQMFLFRISREG